MDQREAGAMQRGRPRQAGLTLVELMLAVAIIGILLGLAYPSYRGYRERVQAADAVTDIGLLSVQIKSYRIEFQHYPDDISDAFDEKIEDDPWGNPYQYLNVQSNAPGTKGKRRKDKNLVPINSGFDLYSKGPDGDSKPPLTAPPSHDDIIRADDGGYIGVARDY
jgi:general secretion pathway protein G